MRNLLDFSQRNSTTIRIFATWNPNAKSANVTLSNGNLTATRAGAGNVLATIGKNSGKWYWEVKMVSSTGVFDVFAGITKSGASLSALIGNPDSNGYAIALDGGDYYHGGFIAVATGVTFPVVANDIVSFALDATGGTLHVKVNNVFVIPSGGVSGDPLFTGITAGTYYPGLSVQSQTTVMTANFGATTQVYSPPAGYNAGLYTDQPNV